jgi:hypothetical protein
MNEATKLFEGEGFFARMVVLDWHDGPIEGIGKTQEGAAFCFKQLAILEGEETDERIYGLSEVPTDAFNELVSELTRFHAPRWPAWVVAWSFDSAEDQADAERAVAAIENQRKEPTLVALTHSDLTQGLTALIRCATNVPEHLPTLEEAVQSAISLTPGHADTSSRWVRS